MEFKTLITIDSKLVDFLSKVEKYLNITLDKAIVNKILTEAKDDQVTEKNYSVFETKGLSIHGIVDEYEPETVWIEIKNIKSADVKYFEDLDSSTNNLE
jgi:hypothetical protein